RNQPVRDDPWRLPNRIQDAECWQMCYPARSATQCIHDVCASDSWENAVVVIHKGVRMDLLGRSATRRRFLGLTFLVVASTVLAACSSERSGSAPSSSAAPTSASAAPTPAASAAPPSAPAAAATTAPTAAPAANAAPSSGTVTIQPWIPWEDKPSV